MGRRLCISYETFAKKVDYMKTVDKAGKNSNIFNFFGIPCFRENVFSFGLLNDGEACGIINSGI